MIDIPEKTQELIAALKAALPFTVTLTPEIIASLARGDEPLLLAPRQMISKVTYAGESGGIMCGFEPEGSKRAVVLSLTHVRVSPNLPFAKAVAAYQKHRVKKIKKQKRGGPLQFSLRSS